MDRSKRNAYLALAIAVGVIAGLVIIILLMTGSKAAVIAATGIGVFVGTSGLALGIMAACGMFTPKT